MDQFLPAEMLAKVASFLSKKDCDSLSRTSKTAQRKLKLYRNILPKAKLTVQIRPQYTGRSVLFRTYSKERSKPWTVITLGRVPDKLTTDEDEAEALLLAYHREQYDWPRVRLKPFKVYKEVGLSMYMKFLSSHFNISHVDVMNLHDDRYATLSSLMKEHRWNVEKISLSGNAFTKHIFVLITALNPRKLEIARRSRVPEGFYLVPAIQNLEQLVDYSDSNIVMHDKDLLSFSGKFVMSKNTDVSIQGFMSFVTEWMEGGREVKSVTLRLNWRLADVWRDELAALNQDLFDIEPIPKRGHECAFHLRRRSDGLVLKMEVTVKYGDAFKKTYSVAVPLYIHH